MVWAALQFDIRAFYLPFPAQLYAERSDCVNYLFSRALGGENHLNNEESVTTAQGENRRVSRIHKNKTQTKVEIQLISPLILKLPNFLQSYGGVNLQGVEDGS